MKNSIELQKLERVEQLMKEGRLSQAITALDEFIDACALDRWDKEHFTDQIAQLSARFNELKNGSLNDDDLNRHKIRINHSLLDILNNIKKPFESINPTAEIDINTTNTTANTNITINTTTNNKNVKPSTFFADLLAKFDSRIVFRYILSLFLIVIAFYFVSKLVSSTKPDLQKEIESNVSISVDSLNTKLDVLKKRLSEKESFLPNVSEQDRNRLELTIASTKDSINIINTQIKMLKK